MGKLKNKAPRTGYTAPSIEITHHNRQWLHIPVSSLKEGDIVANMGLIKLVMQTCGEEYYIQAGEGEKEYFLAPDHEVYAFIQIGQ